MDDLFDNTLGAMIGYFITPFLCHFLPTRDRLDEISVERARKLTWVRRVTSAVIDWVVYAVIVVAFLFFIPNDSGVVALFLMLSYPFWVILIFVVCQKYSHGRTPGKYLLKLRLTDLETPGQLHLRHLLIRYGFIYFALPFSLMITAELFLLSISMTMFSETAGLRLSGLLILFAVTGIWTLWLTRTLKRHGCLPHKYYSHTDIIKCEDAKVKQ